MPITTGYDDTRPATLRVTGSRPLVGSLAVPGDKSISHRAVLLAALTPGTSRIAGLSHGTDVRNSVAAIVALGAEVVELEDGAVEITGGRLTESKHVVEVGNSGTGIRLLAGIAAGLPFLTVLQGDASIGRRPMDRVTEPLRRMGAAIDGRDGGRFAPLVIRGGNLQGIVHHSPVASAQVKSAVLLAGLGATGATTIDEPSVSRRHTEEMLAARGADITVTGTSVRLRPSVLSPVAETVPGDPSQAAFWVAAASGVPGSEVEIRDIYLGPARDGFLTVLRRMGAELEITATGTGSTHTIRVRGTGLRGTEIGPSEIPGLVDEIPALAVAAALADGVTRITGAAELRLKESDRIVTTAGMLRAFGAAVDELDDGLVIHGNARFTAAGVHTHG
ncbi:MAG TPA: 3-phosphoshikimate 1-carboxyvinyltransferase, partial [Micromonosporaceae bacterium]